MTWASADRPISVQSSSASSSPPLLMPALRSTSTVALRLSFPPHSRASALWWLRVHFSTFSAWNKPGKPVLLLETGAGCVLHVTGILCLLIAGARLRSIKRHSKTK